jgi:hypothetical protein
MSIFKHTHRERQCVDGKRRRHHMNHVVLKYLTLSVVHGIEQVIENNMFEIKIAGMTVICNVVAFKMNLAY